MTVILSQKQQDQLLNLKIIPLYICQNFRNLNFQELHRLKISFNLILKHMLLQLLFILEKILLKILTLPTKISNQINQLVTCHNEIYQIN